jgi:hypothetical protein
MHCMAEIDILDVNSKHKTIYLENGMNN